MQFATALLLYGLAKKTNSQSSFKVAKATYRRFCELKQDRFVRKPPAIVGGTG